MGFNSGFKGLKVKESVCYNPVTEDLNVLLGPVIMRDCHAAAHVQYS